MFLHDFSAPIDAGLGSDLGTGLGQPAETGGSQERPINPDSSHYRHVLARSLSDAKPDKSAAAADHETVPAETPTNPPAVDDATDPAVDGHDRDPVENPSPVDNAAADRSRPSEPISTNVPPQLQTALDADKPAAATNVAETQTGQGTSPAGLQLIGAESDIPVITLSDDVPPAPPPNIQLLLDEIVDESDGQSAHSLVGFESGEPLSPPAGLYKASRKLRVESGESKVQSSNDESKVESREWRVQRQHSQLSALNSQPLDRSTAAEPDLLAEQPAREADGRAAIETATRPTSTGIGDAVSEAVQGTIQAATPAKNASTPVTGFTYDGTNVVIPVSSTTASAPAQQAGVSPESALTEPASAVGQPVGGTDVRTPVGRLSETTSTEIGDAVSKVVHETIQTATPAKNTSTSVTDFTHDGTKVSIPVSATAASAPAQQAGVSPENAPAGPASAVGQPAGGTGLLAGGTGVRTPVGGLSATASTGIGDAVSKAVQETIQAAMPAKNTSTSVTGSTHDGTNVSIPVSSTTALAPAQQAGTSPEVDPAEFVLRVVNAVRSAQQHRGQLRARLHPPELGTLQIEVSVRDGMLLVQLEVSRAAAQRALIENMPLLHEALARHGTQVAHIDVQLNLHRTREGPSEQSGEQPQEPQQQQQEPQQQQQEPQQRPSGQQQSGSDDQAAEEYHPPQPTKDRGHMDQLDIQI